MLCSQTCSNPRVKETQDKWQTARWSCVHTKCWFAWKEVITRTRVYLQNAQLSPLLIWLGISDDGGRPGAMLSLRLLGPWPPLWPIPPGPIDMLGVGGWKLRCVKPNVLTVWMTLCTTIYVWVLATIISLYATMLVCRSPNRPLAINENNLISLYKLHGNVK